VIIYFCIIWIGLNVFIVGYYGIFVVMINRDQVLKDEVQKLFNKKITIVQIKKAITRNSVKSLHLRIAASLTRSAKRFGDIVKSLLKFQV